jgi:glycosyltransferase involved in cell wall biosynthesis
MMRVVIFRDLPEEQIYSMENYSNVLAEKLPMISKSTWRFAHTQPREIRLARNIPWLPCGAKVDNYYSRYVAYPMMARWLQGDINHIIDEGYGHLLYNLDGKRSIVTCNDLFPLNFPEDELVVSSYSRVELKLLQYSIAALKRAAHITTPSIQTKHDVVNLLGVPDTNVTVIAHGIHSRFRPVDDIERLNAFRSRYGLNDTHNAYFILHVGGTHPYKNIPVLLKALACLRFSSLGMNLILLKVGKPFSTQQQALIARLSLQSHIIHLGYLEPEELVLAYNVAHVLAFPSLWEGFGCPPLEAMACGIPVVTSQAGALPEVVGDAGIMIEPQDYGALARAIHDVLTCKQLQIELIAKGQQRAILFTWEQCVRQTFDLYQQIWGKLSNCHS